MPRDPRRHRHDLKAIAVRVMRERGFLADFSPAALREAAALTPAGAAGPAVRDLRTLPWCSIDNDESRDLDQLTVAEPEQGAAARIRVAVADVVAAVAVGSAIDEHARHNTTSIYTAAAIFPMLPERLSTDLTSLNPEEDRLAVVVEMTLDDGRPARADLYPALVRNRAKLAYNAVGAWLEGAAQAPAAVRAVPGLDGQLRLQDRIAQRLHEVRHRHGALTLETLQARPIFDGDTLTDLAVERANRARVIIEEFMIAANGATASQLKARGYPSIRRVLRSPERWARIVQLAGELGARLPAAPDAGALDAFLARRRAADPEGFPDLSLAVVKLIGRGEYVVETPDAEGPGHFGLAVRSYTHSTAPNRRFPDVVTQRLLKAALAGAPVPYAAEELRELAAHCTEAENRAAKVERQVAKSAAALVLEPRIGERFDAIVTGAAAKGTWVRIFRPPVEGKVVRGAEGLDVGDRVRVELLRADVEQGQIDFARAGGR